MAKAKISDEIVQLIYEGKYEDVVIKYSKNKLGEQ